MRAAHTARHHAGARRSQVLALLAIALSLAAFTPHAVTAWGNEVSSWDRTISEKIHEYENRETLLNTRVDVLGIVLRPLFHLAVLLAALAVAGVLAIQGRWRTSSAVVLTVVGATLLGILLKEVFARPPVDPDGTGHSFPSGHALRTMAAAGALGIVAQPTKWRRHVWIGGTIVVLLTGIAVVYHEWHWLSDVLAGWFVAIAWLGCVWIALRPSALD
jgi:membrane-associated phospholipid phosphatase